MFEASCRSKRMLLKDERVRAQSATSLQSLILASGDEETEHCKHKASVGYTVNSRAARVAQKDL